MKNIFLLVALLFIPFCTIFCQTAGIGKLSGRVVDSSTNLSLSGVSVTAAGSSKGTATISDGTYILSLPPGTYTVRYSYTSFATKEVPNVVIKKGDVTLLDIAISSSKNQLDNVVITASRNRSPQASAFNIQRTSSASSSVIGADIIAKTPDIHAGQILKRVSGLNVQNDRFVVVRGLNAQYNQTMINGVLMSSTETNQNAFSFDLIPSAAIENIVVNKTATPDMPGNFAGGIVQINTRDFPAKDFFSVMVGTGFSDQTIGKDFYGDARGKGEWLGFGGNARDLPTGFPPISSVSNIFRLNEQERIRWLRQLENNLVPVNQGEVGQSFGLTNNDLQFGFGKTVRFKNNNQFGVIAGLSQRKVIKIETDTVSRGLTFVNVQNTANKLTSSSSSSQFAIDQINKFSADLNGFLNLAYSFSNNKITFKTIYSQLFRNTFVGRDNFLLGTGDPLFFDVSEPYVGFNYITEQRTLLNNTLGGEHKTGNNKETIIAWNVNGSKIKSKFPDSRIFAFDPGDSAGTFNTYNLGNQPPEIVKRRSRSWSNIDDQVIGGAFDLTTVFRLKDVKQILKSGVLFQNRRRNGTGDVLPFEFEIDDKPLDAFFAPTSYLNIINDGGPVVNAPNFKANSSLQAAYVSLENRMGKQIRVIWGVRYEIYQQSSSVLQYQYFPGIIPPENTLSINQFASSTVANFLPSANFIYSPFKNTNLRASYSKTVLRPDLRDLIGAPVFDFSAYRFVTGNPSLQSSSITNYDLKFEYFPSSSEIISIGVFQKDILNPIEYGESPAENANVGRLPINSGDAKVTGLEIEVRKKIDFIKALPWLKKTTLFGNLSLLESNIKERFINNRNFPFSPAHRLTGQPNMIINGGINIVAFKGTFDFTMNFNRLSSNIDQLGSPDYQQLSAEVENFLGRKLLRVENFWLKPRNLLDITIRQSFLKGKAFIKFNVINLLAEPTVIFWDNNGNGKYDNLSYSRIISPVNNNTPVSTMDGAVDHFTSYVTGQRRIELSFSYTF